MEFTNYTVEGQIGEGGMAIVYHAKHNLLQKSVAIKVLKKEFLKDENIKKRFLAEARNMFEMNHPNIVKVTDLIEQETIVAFVMEYIEGETLKETIERKGPIVISMIKDLFRQILDAVSYVHEMGYVHRDIKPSNFIINHKGKIKLLDFGIAKNNDVNADDYTITATLQSMGTPMYMSPEQVKSSKDVTHQSDIYSLGVVLWQMVTGERPYSGSSLSSFEMQLKIVTENLPKTGSAFDLIIERSTAKDLENRYKDCQSIRNDLANISTLPNDSLNFHANNEEITLIENQIEKTVVDSQKNQVSLAPNNEILITVCKNSDGFSGFYDIDSRYGVINLKREWIIEPKYNELEHFDQEGYCVAKLGDKWGAIDKKGRWLIQPIFDGLSNFDENGYSIAEKHSLRLFSTKVKYGFVNRKGVWLIQPSFDYLSYFDHFGFCLAKLDDKWGLIDRNGIWKLRPIYEGDITYLGRNDDMKPEFGYKASLKGKTGIINLFGDWIVKPLYEGLNSLNDHELCAAYLKNHWGFINRKGDWIVKPIFDSIGQFDKNGCCAASYKGKYGLINRNADWVLKPNYDDMDFFHGDDVYRAESNGKYGLINKDGTWVLPPTYDHILAFHCNKVYEVMIDKKVGFVDKAGTWVIAPEFYNKIYSWNI